MTDPVADLEAGLAETTRMAERVRAGLDRTTATARSTDGKVTVTVNATGNVVDLRLPDDPALAASVLATIRRAQSRLADAARAAMPPELAGTAVLADLDTQYRTTFPAPESTRPIRRHLRLGAEPEQPPPHPTRRRPPPDGEEPEYGDRTVLR